MRRNNWKKYIIILICIYCWAGGKSGGKGYPAQTVTSRNAGLDGSVSDTVRDRNIRRYHLDHYFYKSHRGGLGK